MDLQDQLKFHNNRVKFDPGVMPTLSQWKEKSRVGNLFGPPYRRDDPTLRWIDQIVENVQGAKGGERTYLLGDLFFTTMAWLNTCKKDPVRMQQGRRGAMLGLNVHVGTLLASALGCDTGGLAKKLHTIYGVELGSHGRMTDANQTDVDKNIIGSEAMYLRGMQNREKFRIFFVNGLAHVIGSAGTPVLLDTTYVFMGNTEEDSFDGRPGRRFVMSMSGALFACNLQSMMSYHSCFMGGGAVMCAGTLLCTNGQITRIKNDSGHYQPVDTSLAKVLARLRSQGVNLSRMIVALVGAELKDRAMAKAKGQELDKDHEVHVNALTFLNQNGNWNSLMSGMTVGRAQARQQCTCAECKKARVFA